MTDLAEVKKDIADAEKALAEATAKAGAKEPTMAAFFTVARLKSMLAAASPHELVYAAAGYYVGAHYSHQVVSFVVKFLGGNVTP